MRQVAIQGREIGPGHPTYIIAEIGSNHNGSIEQAFELIKEAANAGVDAVKFQTFRACDHYSRHAPGFGYLEAQGVSTYDLIRSLEIDRTWHSALQKCAAEHHVTFLSSPCDAEAIDELATLGMPAFKLASFDLPDVKIIQHMSTKGLPLLLSTGMATNTDIESAINAARAVDKDIQIALLQCTSLYPAPVHLSNLRAIQTLQHTFGLPTGYSDHTMGEHICLAGVALGACILEKHFTLSRTQPGPDHPFAMEPAELRQLVSRVRDIEMAAGNGRKTGPAPEEAEMFEKGRRSLHVRESVAAGSRITAGNLRAKRPGYGISPAFYDNVVGMRTTRDIPADHWVTWEDFK